MKISQEPKEALSQTEAPKTESVSKTGIAPTGADDSAAVSRHWKVIDLIFVALFSVLLFVRLGHYSFWDDEAQTALPAKGVLATGDTTAVLDHGNIMAFRSGLVLHNLHDRSTPPFPIYLTAASFSIFGVNAWSARLPFALMGVATIALLLYWARRSSPTFQIIFGLGILCNVSLILSFRQCRYYSPSIFLSVAIAYLYWNWKGNRRQLLLMALCSILLFATHYVICIILYGCLFVDYLFWKRHEYPLKLADWATLCVPQVILSGLLASVWNPFKTAYGEYTKLNTFGEKLTLFYWYLRDSNACEYFAFSLLLLGLGVAIFRRRTWMLRGITALILFIFAMALLAPQIVRTSAVADIRYVAPIIPLGIAISAGAIYYLLKRWPVAAVGVACLAFGTTLLNAAPLGLRSTLVAYLRELANPPPEPYGPTAEWINQNIPENSSVYVVPGFTVYPLMFHAPKVTYAWQFDEPVGQFASLPPIHFKNTVPPDYLIGFGPATAELMNLTVKDVTDVTYDHAATIPVFWKDLYRPELFWRTFTPLPHFDPNSQAVYIFKRSR